jgi:monomeric sarcosine oxidase
MGDRYDVAIVGAGIMGAGTAFWLGRSGRRVAWFEQFDVGHDRGSSHGSSRIFRYSYPEELYVRMAIEARDLWTMAEADIGIEMVRTLGGLDSGTDIEKNAHALEICGADYEMIDGATAARRWPLVSLPPDEPVLHQPDAGIVAADVALRAFKNFSVTHGVELREQTRVLGLQPVGDRISIEADGHAVEAEAVIITAGAWVSRLTEALGIAVPVRTTCETVVYFKLEGVPPPVVEWGEPAIYALPSPGHGLKTGEHIAGPTKDPDECVATDESSAARLAQWVSRRFPSAVSEPAFTETCMYTNTEDQSFILERHDRVIVGSPCSGHGFKFAPLIGQRLARLAEEVL